METVIIIKKNKPSFKALIQLAKELEKNDHTGISINENKKKMQNVDLILPSNNPYDTFPLFEQITDFPSLEEIREKAWPKNL